jgi:hypothetical protein
MNDEDLFELNITYGGSLKPKRDSDVRVAATGNLGKAEHWSSDGTVTFRVAKARSETGEYIRNTYNGRIYLISNPAG